MRVRNLAAAALGTAAGLALIDTVYRCCLRRPALDWGSTPDEAAAALPGDDLLAAPDIVSTRAVTIDAPPSAVWPWLVQMGPKRGGAYTYDWIENLLGLDMHSADRIHPEWQQLTVGEVVPGGPPGVRMRIEILDPEQTMSTRSTDGAWVWTFVLREAGGRTRLLSRNRIAMRDPTLKDRVGMRVMEAGSLVMERKMLLGIKERAERLAAGVL